MSLSKLSADYCLAADDLVRVVAACARFEADWKQGRPRRIEDELSEADDSVRSRLFRELLQLECELMYRAGRCASLDAYLARFPDRTDTVHAVFYRTLDPSVDATGPLLSEEPAFVLEGYELLRKLGEGGQATTFLARDCALQRLVVLKRYHGAASSGRREAVLNEGRALAKIRSPFVAPCLGVRIQGDEIDLIVEFVPGRPLTELTGDERARTGRCARLVEQVAGGLAEVHACGLLHRDIKPGNIILGDDGVPRLVDFGLAVPVANEARRDITGSPRYMAPEQARGQGERIDARTDVFGLGGVLYFLLTGQPPRQGAKLVEVLEKARDAPIVPPRQLNPRFPFLLQRICLKAMAADPQLRYASAEALRNALRRYAFIRRAIPVLGVLAAVLAVLVPSWAFRPGSKRPSPGSPDPAIAALADNAPRTKWAHGALDDLRVIEFEIRHYPKRDEEHFRQNEVGTVGLRSFVAHEDDEVTVRTELSKAAHAYLIAFRPDGTDDICDPDDENSLPPRKQQPRYPPVSKSDETYRLTEGTGLHAFALVVSREPLPTYREWKRRIGPMPWPARLRCEPGVVWRDDDRGLEALLENDPDDIRGKGVKARGSGAPVAKLASWLRGLAGVDIVIVEAFLVEPALGP